MSAQTARLSVTASLSGVAGSPGVEFWLEGHGVLLLRLTSAPPYAVTFTNLASGKYFLGARVENATAVASDVAFDIVAPSSAPPNDHWQDAAPIPEPGAVVSGSNVHATREPGERVHAGASSGRSLWWRWRADSDGLVTATTLGSAFDTVLAVYTGTNLASLSAVAENDDAGLDTDGFSQATFEAKAGTNYFFAVDGTTVPGGLGSSGDVQLRLVAGAPPIISGLTSLNGTALMVPTDRTPTNITATVGVDDPAGPVSVRYWFDGAGISRAGDLSTPSQLALTNLVAGDYWLSVMAVGGHGLVAVEQAGLSVVPLSARIWLMDLPAYTTNGFRFAVTGLRGRDYTVRGSTNLEAWCGVASLTNFAGATKVTDTNASRFNPRFYRAETP